MTSNALIQLTDLNRKYTLSDVQCVYVCNIKIIRSLFKGFQTSGSDLFCAKYYLAK